MAFRSDIRGADYRAKAELARAVADRTPLAEVRRRHEAAALVWVELAEREDRSAAIARAAIDHRLTAQRAAQDALLATSVAPDAVGAIGGSL